MNPFVINPWMLIAAGLAWLGSLVSTGYWMHGVGVNGERVKWQAVQAQAQVVAAHEYQTLNQKYRVLEQNGAQLMAAVSEAYEGRLKDAQAKHAANLAAVRSGSVRLRDPGAAPVAACQSSPGEAVAASGERDGEASGGLSREAAEFLLGLTAEADQVAEQLSACQGVVEQQTAFINALSE